MFFLLSTNDGFAQTTRKPDRLWKVKIEGNTTYKNVVVKKFIANTEPSFFKKILFFRQKGFLISENEIKRDVIRIRRFYNNRGFADAEVSYRLETGKKEWQKILTFTVNEGQPVKIGSIETTIDATKEDSLLIAEHNDVSKVLSKIPFKEGKRFKPVDIPESEGEITQVVQNLGYPYSEAKLEANTDSLNKITDLTVHIDAGPKAYFNSIKVEGEETLPVKYIIRETDIKKGELYTEKKLREAQRELFNHHLFRFALVSIPEQPEDSTINVLIRVKEKPLRSLQIKAGIGNIDRIEPPLNASNFYKVLRGEFTWIYRNVRSKGERFRTSVTISGFEQTGGFDYLFPYVFNTKSSFTTTPFIQHRIERAYEIVRGGITNSLIYEYNENLTASIGYEFTQNEEISKNTQQALPDSILNYNVSSFRFNGNYSRGLKRDQKGWVVQPFAEISGLFNESTYSFQKLVLDVRRYTEINSDLVLATRINTGGIFSAKTDSLPHDIRFFTGGTSSVRGWGRDNLGPKKVITDSTGNFRRYVPIGGNTFFNFNVELRQQLNSLIKGFGIAGFLDGGQVWKSLSAIKPKHIQFGAGGGIRYQSPIGPIRLDIAYKVNPRDDDLNIYHGQNHGSRFGRWGFHLSIGQAF